MCSTRRRTRSDTPSTGDGDVSGQGNAGVEERRTALGGGDLPRTPHPARVVHRPTLRDVVRRGHRRPAYQILVRSGFLLLQLGGWQGVRADDNTGSERTWKGWETVCSFPVLLSVIDHFMAERFLLATHAVPPDGSEPTEHQKKQLSQDLRDYRYVCSARRLDSRCSRILQRFEPRKRAWLKRYGFKILDHTRYTCSLMAVRFINRRLDNWLERFGDEHHQ